MRVTDIALYSGVSPEASEAINFSLSRADPMAKYMVKDIIGLDTVDLIPRFYGFGKTSGLKFYDVAMEAREIVMQIVLNPRFSMDESYSDIRDGLYKAISYVRSGVIVLHFNAGGTNVARIYGFITKLEVTYFSRLPEVQMTIRCDDPMFRAINPVVFKPPELTSTNPIIIPDSLSTAPHGFQMELVFTGSASSFTIQDLSSNPDWTFTIVPSGGFLAGDVLKFSSDYSNKYLYIVRGGNNIYLVDKIQPDSVWPIIFPGSTKLHFVNINVFNWVHITYYAAYWGV
jgi:hypothetical protein